jgi:ubiquinone/menaquinone biosynthesis C-methylase UbiE
LREVFDKNKGIIMHTVGHKHHHNHTHEHFIPVASAKWYDTFFKLMLPELKIKTYQVDNSNLDSKQKILDLGCGTATLTILIKNKFPMAEVVGIDIDPEILKIARDKVNKSGLNLLLELCSSTELKFPNESFDRILSSMAIHHLNRDQKVKTFKEVFRVLRPEGEFHIMDFNKPHNLLMYILSLVLAQFNKFGEPTNDNISGKLPELLTQAGFSRVDIIKNFSTIFGTISVMKAKKS